MKMNLDKKTLEKAYINPASIFASPEKIEEYSGLTAEEKMKILQSWEMDTNALIRAESENMTKASSAPAPEELLRRIKKVERETKAGKTSGTNSL
jgi:hypothetical protein